MFKDKKKSIILLCNKTQEGNADPALN